jgi:hypothetical protein
VLSRIFRSIDATLAPLTEVGGLSSSLPAIRRPTQKSQKLQRKDPQPIEQVCAVCARSIKFETARYASAFAQSTITDGATTASGSS